MPCWWHTCTYSLLKVVALITLLFYSGIPSKFSVFHLMIQNSVITVSLLTALVFFNPDICTVHWIPTSLSLMRQKTHKYKLHEASLSLADRQQYTKEALDSFQTGSPKFKKASWARWNISSVCLAWTAAEDLESSHPRFHILGPLGSMH